MRQRLRVELGKANDLLVPVILLSIFSSRSVGASCVQGIVQSLVHCRIPFPPSSPLLALHFRTEQWHCNVFYTVHTLLYTNAMAGRNLQPNRLTSAACIYYLCTSCIAGTPAVSSRFPRTAETDASAVLFSCLRSENLHSRDIRMQRQCCFR